MNPLVTPFRLQISRILVAPFIGILTAVQVRTGDFMRFVGYVAQMRFADSPFRQLGSLLVLLFCLSLPTQTVAQVVTTLAGDGTAALLNGTGTGARFNSPSRVVSDGAGGNLYVADFSNHCIRRIVVATGVVTTLAGSGVAGFLDATGTAAQFQNPYALWLDGAGNLYVSDGINGARIRRVAIATGVVTSFAGTGVSGFVNGPVASAQFAGIASLTGDGAGNLFVSDGSNNVIRRIVIATGTVSTLAGTGAFGLNNGPGATATFDNPNGIGCDGLNVYVCDAANFCIRKIVIATGVVSTLSGGAGPGTADGVAGVAQFLGLTGDMVYDGIGNFYFGDNNRIRSISAATGAVSTIAGSGTAGFADGTGVAAQFNETLGITRDAAGILYIGDFNNHRIRRLVLPTPTVTSFTATTGYPGLGVIINGTNFSTATQVRFGGVVSPSFTVLSNTQIVAAVPTGGASGNVSVTTPSGTGVHVGGFTFTSVIPPLSTFAGNAAPAGFANGTGGAAQFNNPIGVAFYAGDMFVTDGFNNRVRRITPTGVVTTFAGSGAFATFDGTGTAAQFAAPHGIAADASGNLFVADYVTHRIRVISAGGVVTTLAGSSLGWNDATGTAAQFNGPLGVAFSGGIVYVSDFLGHRIRKITYPGGVVTTLAGSGTPGFADATGLAAQFNNPRGIAVDAAGNVYVADQSNHRIRKITPAGVVTTLAGSGTAGFADATGVLAQFNLPSGVTVDATGTLYVSDATNPRIRVVSPGGVVTTLAGSGTVGFADGTLAAGQFAIAMESLSLDASGNVFVADRVNNAIRRIAAQPPTVTGFTPTNAYALQAVTVNGTNFSGATQVQFGGVNAAWFTVVSATQIRAVVPIGGASGNVSVTTGLGTGSFAGFTFTATPRVSSFAGQLTGGFLDAVGGAAQFVNPNGIGVDAAGNIYVAEQNNHRIRKITATGVVTTFAGSGVAGFANNTGILAQFSSPSGVACDAAGNVYIGDEGNHCIRMITPGGVVTTLAGLGGTSGSADGTGTVARFNNPARLSIDAAGNLYVPDASNHRIRRVTPGGVVTTIAGSGVAASLDGTGVAAQFNSPTATAVDAAGNVYVAESLGNRIRKISPAGVVTTLAGNGTASSVDGTGAAATVNAPVGLATDAAGMLYIIESASNRVRTVSQSGVVTTFAGTGTAGLVDGTLTASQFAWMRGAVADAAGNLYITDTGNNTIRKISVVAPVVTSFTPTSAYPLQVVTITGTDFFGVTQVRFGGVNAAWFEAVSPTQIRAVVPIGAVSGSVTVTNSVGTGTQPGFTLAAAPAISTLAGDGTANFRDAVGAGAQFNYPSGVAFYAGDMFVTDLNNHRVRRITPTGVVTTFAGSGTLGTADGTGAAAQFAFPFGIAADASGNLFVVDSFSNSIRVISSGGAVTTLAGGTAGFADGTGAAAQFNGPAGVAYSGGIVYVCDGQRIRKITYPGGVVTTLAGGVVSGFADATGLAARFTNPRGIAVDAAGNVYVADAGNNRIRKITPAGVVTTLAGSGALGFADGTGLMAQFSDPKGVTVDATGNLYVSDRGNARIRVVSPGGVVTTLAGSGTVGFADGTLAAGQFSGSLESPVLDASGNVFVPDGLNHAIRRIAAPPPTITSFTATTGYPGLGVIITGTNLSTVTQVQFGGVVSPSFTVISNTQIVAAVPTGGATGTVQVTNPSGAASLGGFTFTAVIPPLSTFAGNATPAGYADGTQGAARLNQPIGIVSDGTNMFFADAANHVIRRISATGVVTTFAGSGTSGFANGTGTAAQFASPHGVATDFLGNLYVADYGNHRIRMITSGGVVTTLAGSGVAGFNDATGAAAQFNLPHAILFSGGFLYVTEGAGGNRIRRIDPSTGVVTTIAGGAAAGNADGTGAAAQFDFPFGMANDALGNIYIADQNNHRIRMMTTSGVVTTFAGSTAGFADGTGAAAQFTNPHGIVREGLGNFYITDIGNRRIRYLSSAGVVTTIAGAGTAGFTDGTLAAGQFSTQLSGLALNASGELFIADRGNNAIRRILPPSPVVTSFNATTGYPGLGIVINGANFSGVTQVQFGGVNSPSFTIISPSQIVAAVPAGGASGNVSVTAPTGTGSLAGFTFTPVIPPVSTFAGNGVPAGFADAQQGAALFNSPCMLARDASGNIYVADRLNHRIRRISASGVVTTFAGSGVAGWNDAVGSAAQFNGPYGVLLNAAGTVLYVSDEDGHRIRMINTATAAVTTLAGSGVAGYADNPTGLLAQFNQPIGMALDAAGNLYVCEDVNATVRRITPGGAVTTFAGNGTTGFVDGVGTAARFNPPRGIVRDPVSGDFYVSDYGNHAIRKITPAGVVTTLAGNGTAGNTDGTGSAARFNAPVQMWLDPVGNIYVADALGSKIRVVSPNGVVTTIAGTGVAGFADGATTAAQFQFVNGIVGDPVTGVLTVSDEGNARIRRIVLPAPTVTSFNATTGYPGLGVIITGTNLATVTQVQFGGVVSPSFTVLSNTQIVAAVPTLGASGNVQVTNPGGTASLGGFTFTATVPPLSTFAGNAAPAGFADGTSGAARFNATIGMAFNGAGEMFIGDQNNHRVRKITAAGVVTTFAGNGTSGWADGTGAAAQFNSPSGIATDAANNVYVADFLNHRIRAITPSGVVTTLAGSGVAGFNDATGLAAQFNGPGGVAVSGGNLYVSDNFGHRIRRIVIATGVVTTLAGSGTAGFADGTGAAAQFSSPQGLATDAAGNVYVADHINQRIRKITPGGVVTTLAGSGAGGFADGTSAAAQFQAPLGVSVDAAGNVYVADAFNARVRLVSPLGVVTTLAGSGTIGFLDGALASGQFGNGLMGIALNATNSLFVSDRTNNAIRRVTTPTIVTAFTPTNAGPSDVVTISGVNFTGASQVQFGGVNAASYTVVDANTITATPAAGGATGSVSVTAPLGTSSLAGFTFLPNVFYSQGADPGTRTNWNSLPGGGGVNPTPAQFMNKSGDTYILQTSLTLFTPLTIGNGVTFTHSAGAVLSLNTNMTIAAGGTHTVPAGTSVSIDGPAVLTNNGTLNVSGILVLVNNAGYSGTSPNFLGTANLVYNGSGNLNIGSEWSAVMPAGTNVAIAKNPGTSLTMTGNRTLNGGLGYAVGDLVMAGNTLTLNGGIAFGAGTQIQGGAGASIVVGGAGAITGTPVFIAPQTLGGGLTMNRGGSTLALGSSLTATPLTISGGTLNTGAFAHTFSALNISASGSLAVAAGGSATALANYTVGGNITIDGTFDAGTTVASGTGSIVINPVGTFISAHPAGLVGALTNTGGISYAGTVRIQGATVGNTLGLTLNNLIIDRATPVVLPQNMTVTGTLTVANTGNFALSGQTLTLGASSVTATTATGSIDATSAGSVITINAPTLNGAHFLNGEIRRLNVNSTPTITNSLAISTLLDLTNNITLGAPNGRLWLRNTATLNAPGTNISGTDPTSEVIVDAGFNAGTLSGALLGASYNGALTFLGAHNLTGTLTMSGAAGALAMNGILTLQAATNLNLNQTSANSLMGTGTVQGSGASSVIVLGNSFNAGVLPANRFATTLNANVTTPGGASTLTGGALTLGAAQTLTLGGRLTTTLANTLRVTNTATAAIAGASVTNYIDGPLERALLPNIAANGTSYLFPIGEGTSYRPMTLRDVRTGATSPVMRGVVAPSGAVNVDNLTILTLLSGRNWELTTVSGNFTSTTLELTEGGLTPTDLMGMAGAQAGVYASIGGAPGAGFVRSNAQAALGNRFYAIAGTPPGTFFYNETLMGDASLPSSWNSVANGSGVPASLGLMTSGVGTVFIVRSGITANATTGMTFGAGATLTLQPTSNLTVQSGTLTVNGTANVSGTLAIGNGATLANVGTTTIAATGTLRMTGASSVSGNAPVYAASTSALEYNGANAVTAGIEWLNPAPYIIRIGNSGGVRLASNRTLTNTANLTVQANGSLNINHAVNLVNDGSMIVSGLGAVRLDGNGQISGVSGITYFSTSTLEFTNVSPNPNLNAGAKAFPATMNGNVVINNTVTLPESKQISGSWTGLGGSVNLNSNTLTLNDAITFGGTSFVSNASSGLVVAGSGAMSGLATIAGGAIGTLTMNRAGATLTNAAPIQVSNTLSLQNGFISTTLGMISLTNPAVGALAGGSAASYILGGLERALAANLTFSPLLYNFPLAKGGVYLPFVLTSLTTGAVAPIVRAEAFNTGVGASTLSGMGSISLTEYWQTALVSGAYTNGSAILTRSNLNASNGTAFAAGVGTTFTPSGGSLSGANPTATLTSSPVTGLGRFVITFPSSVLIGDFLPKLGALGTVVNITGSGFTGATAVSFGGTNASSFTVNSATSITATVAAGASGTVQVTTPTGTGVSDSTFTFVPPPSILVFSPIGGAAGTSVLLTGTNFVNVSSVRFNGIPASSFTVLSPTQVRATAPAGGIGLIQITALGGVATSPAPFLPIPPPMITSFSPTMGSSGTEVTIDGSGFNGVNNVKFGTENALYFTYLSPNRITAVVSNAGATGRISATTPVGSTTSTQIFIFQTPTNATRSVAPQFAASGTVVTILGSGFGAVGSMNLINGNTTIPVSSTTVDSTRITFTMPPGLSFVGDSVPMKIVFVSQAGLGDTLGVIRALQTPFIRSVSPDSGRPGTLVTIRGRYFLNAQSVAFATVTLATMNYTVVSDSIILATAPPGVPSDAPPGMPFGDIFVRVKARDVTAQALWHNFAPVPKITQQSLDSGEVGAGVLLTGENFLDSANGVPLRVTFNGIPAASIQILSTTRAIASVPPGVSSGQIRLTTGWGAAVAPRPFRLAQPSSRITSFSPAIGGPWTRVQVQGVRFDSTMVVSFGGIPAPTQFLNATNAIATVPRGVAEGDVLVTLQTTLGTATATGAFIVLPSPMITNIDPISAGADEPITISGKNFINVTSLTLNAAPIQDFTILSDSLIIATFVTVPVGVGVVTAFNVGGQGSYALPFELLPPSVANAPRNLVFQPSFGPAGTRIRITGRNLGGIVGARIGGVSVAGIEQISTTEVIVIVGRGATGAIVLTNGFGTGGSRSSFRYQMPLELDSIALVAFYQAHRSENSTPPRNWLTLNRLTTWEGVTVQPITTDGIAEERITGVNLDGKLLNGRTTGGRLQTGVLARLDQLQTFNLSNNQISGSIAGTLAPFRRLREVRLAGNRFTGEIVSAFAPEGALNQGLNQGLPNQGFPVALEILDLRRNSLTGSVAAGLFALPNLRELLLSDNGFTGALVLTGASRLVAEGFESKGASLQSVAPLERLEISNNQLSGALPPEIGDFTRLQTLRLNGNRLAGALPARIGECVTLQMLDASNNAISGALPQEIRNCGRLEALLLENNRLTALPDMSLMRRRLKMLTVQSNRLDFGALEANMVLDTVRYIPQDTINAVERSVTGVVGLPLRISVVVGGTQNSFAWNAGGRALDRLPAVFRLADTGVYVCRITNSRVPGLTLVTRPVQVAGRLPNPPGSAPQLVLPNAGATGIPTEAPLEWTAVQDAAQYDVQLSPTQDFAVFVGNIQTSSTASVIAGLENLTRYFWRVRATNVGGVGPWSQVRSFVTVRSGAVVSAVAEAFGKTPIGDVSFARMFVKNLTNQAIRLDSLRFSEVENSFETRTAFRSLTLEAREQRTIILAFSPKSIGRKTGNMEAVCTVLSTQTQERESFSALLLGSGTALKALTVDYDTVIAGRPTIQPALLINRGRTPITVSAVQYTNTTNGNVLISDIFSFQGPGSRSMTEPPIQRGQPLTLESGDTLKVLTRCEPVAIGERMARLQWQTSGAGADTAEVEVLAFVKPPEPADVIVKLGIRPVDAQGNALPKAAPGSSVLLELYIAEGNLDSLLRAAQPEFTTSLRYDRNVLSVTAEENSVRILRGEAQSRYQRLQIAGGRWNGRGQRLALLRCRAVAGDTMATALEIESSAWGGLARSDQRAFWERRVFMLAPENGIFQTEVSRAGGTRLIAPAKPALILASIAPNPAKEAMDIRYTLPESGLVEVSLLDARGNIVQSLFQAVQNAGEHTLNAKIGWLASGSYSVQIRAFGQVETRLVQIVR